MITTPDTPSFTSPKPITLSAIREAAGYGTDALDAPPRENGEIGEIATGNVIPGSQIPRPPSMGEWGRSEWR